MSTLTSKVCHGPGGERHTEGSQSRAAGDRAACHPSPRAMVTGSEAERRAATDEETRMPRSGLQAACGQARGQEGPYAAGLSGGAARACVPGPPRIGALSTQSLSLD